MFLLVSIFVGCVVVRKVVVLRIIQTSGKLYNKNHIMKRSTTPTNRLCFGEIRSQCRIIQKKVVFLQILIRFYYLLTATGLSVAKHSAYLWGWLPCSLMLQIYKKGVNISPRTNKKIKSY